MELVEPSVVYKDSYIEASKEFLDERSSNQRTQRYLRLSIEDLKSSFEAYVETLKSQAKGENLPSGFVPATELWLVEEGRFIGSTNIRHRLTPLLLEMGGHIGYDIRPSERQKGYGTKMLELALPKARELGLDRVLVTCDETNVGSKKIIEANGGVFEDKRPNPEGGPDKLRYWIKL